MGSSGNSTRLDLLIRDGCRWIKEMIPHSYQLALSILSVLLRPRPCVDVPARAAVDAHVVEKYILRSYN